MPRLLRFNSKLGGAVLLPAMMASVAITLSLRLLTQQVGQTIFISTALLAIGALILYLFAIARDIHHVKYSLIFSLKAAAILIIPLTRLSFNHLYGLAGYYDLPDIVSFPLTMATVFLIVESFDNGEKAQGSAAIHALVFLGILGIHFFLLGRFTYTFMAFGLVGALLVICYYTFKGDWRIGTQLEMGHSGSLILGFTISYLAIKYTTYNPAVVEWHADAIATPFSLLLVPVGEFIRTHILSFRPAKVYITSLAQIACYAMALGLMYATEMGFGNIIAIELIGYAILATFLSMGSKKGKAPANIGQNPNVQCQKIDFQPGLVSVIMPTWNSKRFVGESIESILSQKYKNLELIITDDASTDGTPELLKEYAAKDNRIKLILNTQNRGAGYSRNCSIEATQGQYIAFCDSDDRWMPEKIEQQVRFMQKKKVALCFSPYYTCDSHNHYLGYVTAPRRISLFGLMCDNKIGFLTAMYDVSLVGKNFMPEQRKRQDHALLLLILKKCHYAYSIQEPLAHYRIHAGNMSGSKIGLLKYNAKTYNAVFNWPIPLCYTFLFCIFLPSYFWKRIKNIMVSISRTQLG